MMKNVANFSQYDEVLPQVPKFDSLGLLTINNRRANLAFQESPTTGVLKNEI